VCFLPQIVLVVVVLGRFRVVRAKLPPAKEPKKHSQGVYPISASKGREFCSEHRERPRTMDDDEDEDDWGTGESRRATVCIEAINQAGQHCYDTGKHFFSGAKAIDRDEAFGDRRVLTMGYSASPIVLVVGWARSRCEIEATPFLLGRSHTKPRARR
jgi:hypothetical protein